MNVRCTRVNLLIKTNDRRLVEPDVHEHAQNQNVCTDNNSTIPQFLPAVNQSSLKANLRQRLVALSSDNEEKTGPKLINDYLLYH